uniref:Uncharacterized protein n=1 Tax=Plectus sambesii TaxID=2011161 RepID=A0A914WZ23_9BILA
MFQLNIWMNTTLALFPMSCSELRRGSFKKEASLTCPVNALHPDEQIVLSQKEEQHEYPIYETGQQNDFEKQCVYNLNHQYEQWKSNGWGKSPICIPDALEVNKKWPTRTNHPDAAGYSKSSLEKKKADQLEGKAAEQTVHKAFQRSTIGGLLIHGFDFASFQTKVPKSNKSISKEIKRSLKELVDNISAG